MSSVTREYCTVPPQFDRGSFPGRRCLLRGASRVLGGTSLPDATANLLCRLSVRFFSEKAVFLIFTPENPKHGLDTQRGCRYGPAAFLSQPIVTRRHCKVPRPTRLGGRRTSVAAWRVGRGASDGVFRWKATGRGKGVQGG